LVARAREGDARAWGQLVNRYAPLVWSICRQFRLQDAECEDVGQTVWLALVETLPQLREPAALPGWLATTTRRECLRVVEATRKWNARTTQIETEIPDDKLAPPDNDVLAAELEAALRDAFAQLEPQCQQLLTLLMQTPRLSYAEISARLDVPIGSIGPTRARCLNRLRRCRALAAWIKAETRNDVPREKLKGGG
jgi:RNA polymerase sigma factor (sigma-70 family)